MQLQSSNVIAVTRDVGSQNWHQSAREAGIASEDLLVGAFDNATAAMCNTLNLPFKRYKDLETQHTGVRAIGELRYVFSHGFFQSPSWVQVLSGGTPLRGPKVDAPRDNRPFQQYDHTGDCASAHVRMESK